MELGHIYHRKNICTYTENVVMAISPLLTMNNEDTITILPSLYATCPQEKQFLSYEHISPIKTAHARLGMLFTGTSSSVA